MARAAGVTMPAATIPAAQRVSWLLVVTVADGIHVLPARDGAPACGHRAEIGCPACMPEPLRDGPFDDPVWSHSEPDWPGAEPHRPDA
jgi:hypothetical protein